MFFPRFVCEADGGLDMSELFKNLHTTKKIKKSEAVEILEKLYDISESELSKVELKKLYRYFVNLKSSRKPKTILELADLFTDKGENLAIKVVKETGRYLYATDSYRLIEIEKKVEDKLDDRYYFKGKLDEAHCLQFPDHKGIMENYEEGNVEFSIDNYGSFVSKDKNHTLVIDNQKGDTHMMLKYLKDFCDNCTNVKYYKPSNSSVMVCFIGEFKGHKVRYIQMPIALTDVD